MALLGSFIDVRTLASIAASGSALYAHGLPAAPDFVLFEYTGGATLASTLGGVIYSSDATNVSVFAANTPATTMRAVAVVAHSIIR